MLLSAMSATPQHVRTPAIALLAGEPEVMDMVMEEVARRARPTAAPAAIPLVSYDLRRLHAPFRLVASA